MDLLQGNMLLIQTTFGLILCLQIGINFAQNPCEPNPCGKNTRCLTQPGSARPVISCKCLPGTYFYRYSFMFFTSRTHERMPLLKLTCLLFTLDVPIANWLLLSKLISKEKSSVFIIGF